MLKYLSRPLLSVIYPQECEVCGGEVESADDGIACSTCWSKTRIFTGNETLCIKCGAFLFGGGASTADAQCRKCLEHEYDRAFSIGLYEHALSASILRLKKQPHIPRRLRHLLAVTLERNPVIENTIVVPVPLSHRRARERGFNQAAVIARAIAKHPHLTLDTQTLTRELDTPIHRAGMDRKARATTVKNAFGVSRPKLIEGRAILLIDDVVTSGATASACAKVLRKHGAATVNVLTIARAA
jgi:ComF family protein